MTKALLLVDLNAHPIDTLSIVGHQQLRNELKERKAEIEKTIYFGTETQIRSCKDAIESNKISNGYFGFTLMQYESDCSIPITAEIIDFYNTDTSLNLVVIACSNPSSYDYVVNKVKPRVNIWGVLQEALSIHPFDDLIPWKIDNPNFDFGQMLASINATNSNSVDTIPADNLELFSGSDSGIKDERHVNNFDSTDTISSYRTCDDTFSTADSLVSSLYNLSNPALDASFCLLKKAIKRHVSKSGIVNGQSVLADINFQSFNIKFFPQIMSKLSTDYNMANEKLSNGNYLILDNYKPILTKSKFSKKEFSDKNQPNRLKESYFKQLVEEINDLKDKNAFIHTQKLIGIMGQKGFDFKEDTDCLNFGKIMKEVGLYGVSNDKLTNGRYVILS